MAEMNVVRALRESNEERTMAFKKAEVESRVPAKENERVKSGSTKK